MGLWIWVLVGKKAKQMRQCRFECVTPNMWDSMFCLGNCYRGVGINFLGYKYVRVWVWIRILGQVLGWIQELFTWHSWHGICGCEPCRVQYCMFLAFLRIQVLDGCNDPLWCLKLNFCMLTEITVYDTGQLLYEEGELESSVPLW